MDDIVAITDRAAVTPENLERAYRAGAFPMGQPRFACVTWHSPDPRAILPLDAFHVSRSLRRVIRRDAFRVTFNQDFLAVMRGCAEDRPVWIGKEFFPAYAALHAQGKAHSVEVWQEKQLVGGLYGVHLGGAFFAESKFHRATDASKVALAALVERLRARGFCLLDVQYHTAHLAQFGVLEVSQTEYQRRLAVALALNCTFP